MKQVRSLHCLPSLLYVSHFGYTMSTRFKFNRYGGIFLYDVSIFYTIANAGKGV